MLRSLIGVSRQDFLRTRVVPANENDIHKIDRCFFCWGPCIEEMTAAPEGDLCPICRIPLFRPPLKVLLHTSITGWSWWIEEPLWQACDFWSGFLGWVRFGCWVLAVIVEPSYWMLRLFLQDIFSHYLDLGIAYDKANRWNITGLVVRPYFMWLVLLFYIVSRATVVTYKQETARRGRWIPNRARYCALWKCFVVCSVEVTALSFPAVQAVCSTVIPSRVGVDGTTAAGSD